MQTYSVIIPIFNNEATLDRTIKSIIQQEHKFSEIILVNNNSTDTSEEICLKYLKDFSEIIYIFEQESGVSNARNAGLLIASSDYILFLDADDVMAKNLLRKVDAVIEKSGLQDPVVQYNFLHEFLNGTIKKNNYILNNGNYQGKRFLEENMHTFKDEMKHMVWTFAFPRSLLKKYKLLFNEKITMFEDILFLQTFFGYDEEILVTNEELVIYTAQINSLSKSNNDMQYTNLLSVIDLLCFANNYTAQQHVYFQQLACKLFSESEYILFIEALSKMYDGKIVSYKKEQIRRFFHKVKRKILK